MANHCYNSLTITGKPDELKKFVEFIKSENTEFDFNKFIPNKVSKDNAKEEWNNIPEEEKGQFGKEDFEQWWYNKYGYGWQVSNWGTKHNAYSASVRPDYDNERVDITFDTAWSPPNPVYAKMIEKFTELSFEILYSEEGCAFEGEIEGSNGEITFNESYELSSEECPECEEYCSKRNTEDNYNCDNCGHTFVDKKDRTNIFHKKIKEVLGVNNE
jgi:hypothetical protein